MQHALDGYRDPSSATPPRTLIAHPPVGAQVSHHLSDVAALFDQVCATYESGEFGELTDLLRRLHVASHQVPQYPLPFLEQKSILKGLAHFATNEQDPYRRRILFVIVYQIAVRSPNTAGMLYDLVSQEQLRALINSPEDLTCRIGFLYMEVLCWNQQMAPRLIASDLPNRVLDRRSEYVASLSQPHDASTEDCVQSILGILAALVTNLDQSLLAIELSADFLQTANVTFAFPSLQSKTVKLIVALLGRVPQYDPGPELDAYFQNLSSFVTGIMGMEFPRDNKELLNDVVKLASQRLWVASRLGDLDFVSQLPMERFVELFQESDNRLLTSLLTLFINVVSAHHDAAELLLESCRPRLYQLYLESTDQSIRTHVIWLFWLIFRAVDCDRALEMCRCEDRALYEAFIDSFDTDNFDFVKKALVPGIIGVVRKFRDAGREEEFAEELNEFKHKVTDMCYREGSSDIQCLAATCLKNAFPAAFDEQGFL
jgi:hypothetical protein